MIIGDANLSEISTYLKVGTTALVLAMIEDAYLTDDLAIAQPVRELHDVSHDPSLQHAITLADGRTITALDLQGEYLDRARKYVDDRQGTDADDQTPDVLARWESVLTRLADDPMLLARELDWVAKLRLLEGYRERDGLDWSSSRLQLVDLQYSDIRPEKGLYNRLVSRGAMDTLLDDGAAQLAVGTPPDDTRAFFRGECLRRYGQSVAAAVVGLGDLRRRPGVAGAGADAGTVARHRGARRRAARPVCHGGRARRSVERTAQLCVMLPVSC